jgi:hypothetical protein
MERGNLNGKSGETLILLTDPLSFGDNQALAEWLAGHRIESYRATDPIDAVGRMSDFTLDSIPDLITIPERDQIGIAEVVAILKSLANQRSDPTVFQYTSNAEGRPRCISLDEIDEWLRYREDRGTS